jgi:predicted TIM-barrel fold metal-dependent hydrolase
VTAQRKRDLEAELLGRLTGLPVIDTHEHMATEAEFLAGTYDFTSLMSYVGLDLGLAGFPAPPWGGAQSAVWSGDSVADKWNRIKPYWPFVRTGCYGRAYRRILQRFFGADDLDDDTVRAVSERIPEYQREGVYDGWLHGRYGIRVMLHVGGPEPTPEPEHFAPVWCFDGLAGAWSVEDLRSGLGQDPPPRFADFSDAARARIEEAASNGVVGLKIGGTARRRALDFAEHSPGDVEASYQFLLGKRDGEWLDAGVQARLKPFQDAAHWLVFERAGGLGLPVQVHSGLEFDQPWDGRPACLIPSIVRFPDTSFALFHGSYPHMADLTGMAKSFRTVYLDLAWFHLLSRRQARAWLAEWLDVLPHNKILGFGGDVHLFFAACTHLEIARENLAAVLARRVADGFCDLDEATVTARLLLHDNPQTLFHLPAPA